MIYKVMVLSKKYNMFRTEKINLIILIVAIIIMIKNEVDVAKVL